MTDCTSPTIMVDAGHPRVRTFAKATAEGAKDDRERTIRLYYAVRDGIRLETEGH